MTLSNIMDATQHAIMAARAHRPVSGPVSLGS